MGRPWKNRWGWEIPQVYLSLVVVDIDQFVGQYCDNIYNIMMSHSRSWLCSSSYWSSWGHSWFICAHISSSVGLGFNITCSLLHSLALFESLTSLQQHSSSLESNLVCEFTLHTRRPHLKMCSWCTRGHESGCCGCCCYLKLGFLVVNAEFALAQVSKSGLKKLIWLIFDIMTCRFE